MRRLARCRLPLPADADVAHRAALQSGLLVVRWLTTRECGDEGLGMDDSGVPPLRRRLRGVTLDKKVSDRGVTVIAKVSDPNGTVMGDQGASA